MKLPRLQYITESPTNVEKACRAGIKWIQGRIKNKSVNEITSTLSDMQKICRQHDCTFIVNDYLETALEINADGVHLGKNDLSIPEAKQIIRKKNFIVGGTANTLEDVQQLAEWQVDYIGLGPLRFTATKEKLSPVLGTDGYKHILSTRIVNTTPVFAIGGIVPADLSLLMETGIYGIAVSGYISHAKNIKASILEFETELKKSTHER